MTLELTSSEVAFIRIACEDYLDSYGGSTYPEGSGWDDICKDILEQIKEKEGRK